MPRGVYQRPEPEERFFKYVDKRDDGCWLWTGARGSNTGRMPYGVFRVKHHNIYAHRWSYIHTNSAVPDGLQLDHLCRNTLCVNPAHLEAVTGKENQRRGLHGVLKTPPELCVCSRGHRQTPENRKFNSASRTYACRVCANETHRIWSRTRYNTDESYRLHRREQNNASRRRNKTAGSAAIAPKGETK